MTCAKCVWQHEQRGVPPDCGICEKPDLLPCNEVVWDVFCTMTTQVRSAGLAGFVGYDFAALPVVLTAFEVPQTQWREVLHGLMVLNSEALAYNAEKHDQGRH